MRRTTPPRPLDVASLFPELAAHRGTTTRLHPRPGEPDVTASSVGGPMLWPADEPWPVCTEAHGRGRGRRPADIRRKREVQAAAWTREPYEGMAAEELRLVEDLDREHRVPEASDTDPLPLLALAQLYARDVPDLPPGPEGADLLQVFWCPFDAHRPTGYSMFLHVRWRRSAEVDVENILTSPPQPQVVGYEGYVPEPCELHPEQVETYPFAGLLPEELRERIDAWEEELEEEAEDDEDDPVSYQFDLSIPPGWQAGGYASWHVTDPYAMDCAACATPMRLLLTVGTSEWGGGYESWTPIEDRGLRPYPHAVPTGVVVGNHGRLNVFGCPSDPAHPPRWSVQ
ncbi:hypothetical protein AQF52_5066 [Streptomyces venezuelae]|uniref:DUF1963 domain-containing protein n=1 Tax=Streptomyces gardneri TaxID=66892 RepID=UPI0006BC4F4F|nr:DUF1963 domain-containing protein [Streptomyces gardneri]ALO10660.1 hypothetical protein AQF52_5066 [Streptomyces venezuelae]QPK47643.1 DUF1963 domain-containing protein [Streptomyces gardneri]WRK39086.1 DUF1963 domain-containing protein [Streptomyces venezuelae]CUM38863.1 hypothetical protein BN2537_6691 [Streptomyces venezuelae]